ncbi:GerAB/ArcD/ProY family transporter [Paenibacillus thalictri]|uniref:Spore gernimation protein n=1 Tax=Paenibacillus thalictri TaxID=2527873 RepID=A0A4Q9DZ88_9BACL|nr:endospore germination permease [Paenibacillus thalictri]TBL80581.1 spore gernimation protein [Paenibacillus thalictri]
MNTNQRGLNLHQMVTLFMLSSGLMDHVIVIPFLLGIAGRSAWISVFCIGVLLTCWLPLLLYVMKKTNMEPIFIWVRGKYGEFLASILRIPVMLYLFAIGTITVMDTIAWVKSMFLPDTPNWFITFLLMGVCVWAANSGIRTIARCGIFLLPLVVLFGIFVATVNIPRKHYHFILPVLENGFGPVAQGMFIVGGGMVEIALVLLLQQHLQDKMKFRHLLFTLWALVGLTVGPLIGAIAEFGPDEAARLRYPAYEEWRLVRIGHYVEHVDFLSIFQWLSGAFIRISLAIYMMMELLHDYLPQKKASLPSILVIAALMIVIVLHPHSDKDFVQFLNQWFFSGAIVITLFLSLGVMLLASFKKQGRSDTS